MYHVIYCSKTKQYVHGFDCHYLLVVFCKNAVGAEKFPSGMVAEKIVLKLSSATRGHLLEVRTMTHEAIMAADFVDFHNVVQALV